MRDFIELLAFCDERKIRGKWLYHGFILTTTDKCPLLTNDLINTKKEAGCPIGKRIHFVELTSKSNGSPSTRTAVKWAKLFRDKCYENMWFYLLGVNLSNINYDAFGPKSNGQDRHFRIYNKFFEIGLFAACRWFFDSATVDIEVANIFSEERSSGRRDPFPFHAPSKINQKESNVFVRTKHITQIPSTPSKEKKYPDYVHVLNLADVLVGSFSEIFDYSSTQSGCIEVAEKLCSVCDRLSNRPFNKRSRYYKKYAMSFFPKYKLKSSEILQSKTSQLGNQFYNSRQISLNQLQLL